MFSLVLVLLQVIRTHFSERASLIFNFLWLQIRERCKELILTDETVAELMRRILKDVEKGLSKDTHKEAVIKCFVTYVQDLPNGTGRFRVHHVQ